MYARKRAYKLPEFTQIYVLIKYAQQTYFSTNIEIKYFI